MKIFSILRKTALVLAFVTAANMPVFASSYARVNKTRVIREGEMPSDLYLTITPLDEVETGSSIVISFTNANVPEQSTINSIYGYKYCDWNGKGFWDVMPYVKTNELPYSIRRSGKREIEVKLINLPRRYANNHNIYQVNGSGGVPVYRIRLPFIADEGGTMNISINSNETTISSANLCGYTIYDGSRVSVEANGINTDSENAEEYEKMYGTTTEASTEATTAAVTETTAEATTEAEKEENADEIPEIFELEPDELVAVRDIVDVASIDDTESYADWNGDTKTVTIYYKDKILEFTDGSDFYVLNGEIIYFEEDEPKAVIIDKKMYVPVGIAIDALELTPPVDENGEETTEEAEEDETPEAAEITEADTAAEEDLEAATENIRE